MGGGDLRRALVAILVMVGFALVAYGVGMFSPPAGVIASGVLLTVWTVLVVVDVSGGER